MNDIEQAYDNGFTPLVPEKPNEKYPGFKDWQNFVMTPELLQTCIKNNIQAYGLLAAYHPGVDIDITNIKLVVMVRSIAFEILGETMIRTGRHPKCLLPYNTLEPFTKRTLKIQREGMDKPWLIEILGDGQQYVLLGKHPGTGENYLWSNGNPIDKSIDTLPLIDADMADEFLRAVAAKLDPKKWTVTFSGGNSNTQNAAPVVLSNLLAPSIEEVREVVSLTPNPESLVYDDFRNFGLALKGATGKSSEGYEVFCTWANRWGGGDSSEELQAKIWSGEIKTGWDQLRRLAQQYNAEIAHLDFDCPADQPITSVVVDQSFTRADVYTADGVAYWMAKQAEFNYVAFDRAKNAWHQHDPEGYWVKPFGNNRGYAYVWPAINSTLERMHEWFKQQPLPVNKDAKKEARKALGNLQSTRFGTLVRAAMERTGKWDFNSDKMYDDPDRTNHLLNTPEGTYDFRKGKLLPFDPLNFITRQTRVPIKYDDSKMPVFMELLQMVTNNPEEIDFLQRYFGSALSGESAQKVMLVLHGLSDSGKTTVTEALAKYVLGYDKGYAVSAPSNVLLRRPSARDDPHPTGLHSIMRARFASLQEIGADLRWNEHTIKSLTGSDSISVREIYGNPLSLRFYGRLVVTANTGNLPQTDVVDSGTRRRMLFMQLNPVPLDKLVGDKKNIIERDEAPYILGWLMVGYQKNVVRPVSQREYVPQSMIDDTKELLEEGDPVRTFVDEMLILDGDDDFTTTGTLFTVFSDFCMARNYKRGNVKNAYSMGHALREIEVLQKLKHKNYKGKGYMVRVNEKRMQNINTQAAIEDITT